MYVPVLFRSSLSTSCRQSPGHALFRRRADRHRGITLVEMLISVTLTLLLMSGAL